MSRFIAVDVKTANSSKASICHVALAVFESRSLVWEWSALVNPESSFDERSIRFHGITPEHVGGKPTRGLIIDHLSDSLRCQVLTSHTMFHAHAFDAASKSYGLTRGSTPAKSSDECGRNTVVAD